MNDKRTLKQCFVSVQCSPVFPDAVDQSVIGEAKEESVNVFVGLAADGRRFIEVLTEDVRPIGNRMDIIETDCRQVIPIDLSAVRLRRRRRTSQYPRSNFVFATKHRLSGRSGKLSKTVPPLDVFGHERQAVDLASNDKELFDCGFIAIAHLIPQQSGDDVATYTTSVLRSEESDLQGLIAETHLDAIYKSPEFLLDLGTYRLEIANYSELTKHLVGDQIGHRHPFALL